MLLATTIAMVVPASFALSAAAFTEPGITGTFADYANCPVNAFGADEKSTCVHSYVTAGAVQIGHSRVPVSVPGDTLDLGVGGTEHDEPPICALFLAAGTGCVVAPPHGILSGPAQPVPGGLLGTIGSVQLTGVIAKFEWATTVPPGTAFGVATKSSDPFATFDLTELLTAGNGTVATLSAKIHLISPFLGPNCYIGSATSPIRIALTSGLTNPPPPAKPIHGNPYESLHTLGPPGVQAVGTTLVNNSFSVPTAHGCGTSGGALIDASINHKLELPSPPGHNLITITATSEETATARVLEHG